MSSHVTYRKDLVFNGNETYRTLLLHTRWKTYQEHTDRCDVQPTTRTEWEGREEPSGHRLILTTRESPLGAPGDT